MDIRPNRRHTNPTFKDVDNDYKIIKARKRILPKIIKTTIQLTCRGQRIKMDPGPCLEKRFTNSFAIYVFLARVMSEEIGILERA